MSRLPTADIYHECLSTHRHFDSLSQAALTAMAAVIGATPVAYDRIKDLSVGGLAFWGGAVLVWLAFTVYSRFDGHAAMALLAAAAIEREAMEPQATRGVPLETGLVGGVGHAFFVRKAHPSINGSPSGFVYNRVRIVAVGSCLVFFICGGAVLAARLGWVAL